MYQVSDSFKSAMRNGRKELRVLCGGETLNTFGVNYTSSVSENIGIGAVSAASITFKALGRLDLIGKPLTVEVGVNVDDEISYIPIGNFLVEESKSGDEVTEVTAYDAAYYDLGGDYVPSTTNPPGTALAVLRDLCAQCGLSLADTSGLVDQPVSGNLTGHTCRDMAGYMAALLGCNAIIDREGKLALKWFADSGQQITPDDYYSGGLKLEGETVLAGLRVTKKVKRTVAMDGYTTETEETEVFEAGSGSGTVIAIENPYFTQSITDTVWSRLRGLSGYRWGSVELFGGLLTEPGDVVTVTDLQGNVSRVPVMGLTLHLDGGCRATITAGGKTETETTANVQGPMSRALSKVQADLARFRELEAENARIQQATIERLATMEIRSTNYREAEVPFVYPAADLYPGEDTCPSDGRTIIQGYRIDLSTGTMYGNWSLPQEILDRLDLLEHGPLYPRAALYPA